MTPTLAQRAACRAVLGLFRKLRAGRLEVRLPDGSARGYGAADGPSAVLAVRDWRFFPAALLGGDVGLGEAYTAGWFDSADLTALLRLFIANEEHFAAEYMRLARLKRLKDRVGHLFRANTLSGSRKNIRAHYDLSNDMFGMFLDESMTYSCALFDAKHRTLAEAQRNKRRAIIEKARIGPGDHVLEIGCGWGSFALEAARQTGCRVTGISLSERQLEHARERARREGLEDRVRFEFRDYRHVQGRFDRIVSIEMLEAVGHENFGAFFSSIDRLLVPHGIAVLQVITIPDHRYEAYRRGCDWIQKHIFPGSLLPSLTALSGAMARESRLMIEHLENIGVHYAPTLKAWRERFSAAADRVRALGFGDDFVRAWDYYFSYCEAGFGSRIINDIQLVLTRQGNRLLPSPERV